MALNSQNTDISFRTNTSIMLASMDHEARQAGVGTVRVPPAVNSQDGRRVPRWMARDGILRSYLWLVVVVAGANGSREGRCPTAVFASERLPQLRGTHGDGTSSRRRISRSHASNLLLAAYLLVLGVKSWLLQLCMYVFPPIPTFEIQATKACIFALETTSC